jgi:hypothetical protein
MPTELSASTDGDKPAAKATSCGVAAVEHSLWLRLSSLSGGPTHAPDRQVIHSMTTYAAKQAVSLHFQTERSPVEAYSFGHGDPIYIPGLALRPTIPSRPGSMRATDCGSVGRVWPETRSVTLRKAKETRRFLGLDSEPSSASPPRTREDKPE